MGEASPLSCKYVYFLEFDLLFITVVDNSHFWARREFRNRLEFVAKATKVIKYSQKRLVRKVVETCSYCRKLFRSIMNLSGKLICRVLSLLLRNTELTL